MKAETTRLYTVRLRILTGYSLGALMIDTAFLPLMCTVSYY
jgi:hypothetical protein